MSSLALFTKMPVSALEGLVTAAMPKKKLFGGTTDNYEKYLASNGREIVQSKFSGTLFTALLPYLEEVHGIDLMKSERDELAKYLTKTRNATHFILTDAHRSKYLHLLEPERFSEQEMENFVNEFYDTKEAGSGAAMRDGIDFLNECLKQVDPESVVVLRIY